jgi:hypothetical protein
MMGRRRRNIWVVLRLEEVPADDRGLQNEGMVEVAEMIAPDDEGNERRCNFARRCRL